MTGNVFINKGIVVGDKVSGGTDSGKYTETVLFEDITEIGIKSGEITLNDDFTKYDKIGFIFDKQYYLHKQESYTEVSTAILVKTLELYEGTERLVILDSVAYRSITVTAKSHTQFKLDNSSDDCAVKKVIGIKYGSSGGSSDEDGIETLELRQVSTTNGVPIDVPIEKVINAVCVDSSKNYWCIVAPRYQDSTKSMIYVKGINNFNTQADITDINVYYKK